MVAEPNPTGWPSDGFPPFLVRKPCGNNIGVVSTRWRYQFSEIISRFPFNIRKNITAAESSKCWGPSIHQFYYLPSDLLEGKFRCARESLILKRRTLLEWRDAMFRNQPVYRQLQPSPMCWCAAIPRILNETGGFYRRNWHSWCGKCLFHRLETIFSYQSSMGWPMVQISVVLFLAG